MADSIMSKAATMEIPINSNGDTGTPEDDSLEQVSQSHALTDMPLYCVLVCCDQLGVFCPPLHHNTV